jgi:HEAT repeat protein/Mg-chelatase subunit ChlD
MRSTTMAGALLLMTWMGWSAPVSDALAKLGSSNSATVTAAVVSATTGGPLAGASRQDGEALLKDFTKLYRKFKTLPQRVEAIHALEDVQLPGVVEVLVPFLEDDEPAIVEAATDVISKLESPEARAEVWELALARRQDEPLRLALLEITRRGAFALAAERLPELQALLGDKEWSVRRGALMSWAVAGPADRDVALAPLALDEEPAVRASALESLGTLKSELLLPPGLAALEDPVWQVRVSAMEGLARLRHKDSIGPLIDALEREPGRLKDDAAKALTRITGRDFGTTVASWRRFWKDWGDKFVVPTEAELAKRRESQATTNARYETATAFNGIETPSVSMLFVIDVSGSMKHLMTDKERFKDRGYPSLARIEIVKFELKKTIGELGDNVKFNVVAFGTEIDPWRKELVSANGLQKAAAQDWIDKLEPLGASTKNSDLIEAGLQAPDANNSGGGRTNTHDALMYALGMVDAKGKPIRKADYRVEVDTVFFLSDGRPSAGPLVDPSDILRVVAEVNALRKAVIHTIALGDFDKRFMKTLAEDSGGQFVDLGQ